MSHVGETWLPACISITLLMVVHVLMLCSVKLVSDPRLLPFLRFV